MKVIVYQLLTICFLLDLCHGFRLPLGTSANIKGNVATDSKNSESYSSLNIFQKLLESWRSEHETTGEKSSRAPRSPGRKPHPVRAAQADVRDIQPRADYDNYDYYDYDSDYPYWIGYSWNNYRSNRFCRKRKVQKNLKLNSATNILRSGSLTSICGDKNRKKRDIEARIIGGEVADENEWPWLVGIGPKDYGIKCGATLITKKWLLTAAHCFERKENPCEHNARLGEHHLFIGDEAHVDITFKKIVVHPNYNDVTMANDIALVKLSKQAPVDNKDDVNVVCLPDRNEAVDVGERCWTAGWGVTGEDHSGIAPQVKHVKVAVQSRKKCKNFYKNEGIHRNQICAGDPKNGGSDSCQGDSGGPLMCERNGQWEQIGVTSWGVGCGRKNKPGIYTFVPKYIEWIDRVISTYGN